jgi:hypothetical protein
MAQHDNYWSCSRFADLIRGTKKPFALEWDEWDTWYAQAEAAHPWRYWLAEVALGKLQDFLYSPQTKYLEIKYYLINRFIDQSHLINTGLKPGQCYEVVDKILHGLFNELVEFVEIELSLHHRAWKDGPRKPRRLADWGLKHLEWEMSLRLDESLGLKPGDERYGEPTPQATAAVETKAIYDWWTTVRPYRSDPFDLMNKNEESYEGRYGAVNRLEKQYEDEDTDMMCRLIKHRACLWT